MVGFHFKLVGVGLSDGSEKEILGFVWSKLGIDELRLGCNLDGVGGWEG